MDPDAPMQIVLDRFWRRAEPRGAVVQDDPCLGERTPSGAETHGGCGKTRIGWSYTGEDDELGGIVVCAVGDMAYAMPRFL